MNFAQLQMACEQTFLPALALVSLAVVILYLIQYFMTTVRNIHKSDLHKIPSPPLPLWSRYTIGHNQLLFTGNTVDTAKLLNSWRKLYGPIFTIRSVLGERQIMAFSESSIQAINITKSKSFRKPRAARGFLTPIGGDNGIFLAEGEKHARLRKAVAPAMHHDALVAVSAIFLEQGKILADRCANHGDTGADILRDVRIGTFTVIFQTCFGKGAVSKDVQRKLQDAYVTAVEEPPWHLLTGYVLRKIFWYTNPLILTWRGDLKKYIRETIFDLCAGQAEHPNEVDDSDGGALLELMVDENSKKRISLQEMFETALSFLAAGQATTSLAVCWLLYLFAKYPEWQKRVHDELRRWKEEDGLHTLDRLPILHRVVKESLRLYPPACFTARNTSKEVEIDGFKVPPGTTFRIPMMAVMRDEDIWGPDTHEFNPDRFLDEDLVERTKLYWCVFLFGPRGCVGRQFAMLEIKAFVAQVLNRVEVFVKPNIDPAPTCHGPFATPEGMKLHFKDRVVA